MVAKTTTSKKPAVAKKAAPAKKAPAKPKPPVNAGYAKKAPSEMHKGFAEYIGSTAGVEVPAETVGLVQRLYPLYLKTPEVVEARDKAREAREAAQAEKTEAKRAKARARLAELDAKRQKLLEQAGIDGADLQVVGDVGVITAGEEPEDDSDLDDVEDAEDEDDVEDAEDEDDVETDEDAVEVESGEDDTPWDDEDESEDVEDVGEDF